MNHPVIGKLEEITLIESIRRKGFPRERKVSKEQHGAELETTNKTHQYHLHKQHQQPTADKSGVGPARDGLPENGAGWDRGESEDGSMQARLQRGKHTLALEAWALASSTEMKEMTEPARASAPGAGSGHAGPR